MYKMTIFSSLTEMELSSILVISLDLSPLKSFGLGLLEYSSVALNNET